MVPKTLPSNSQVHNGMRAFFPTRIQFLGNQTCDNFGTSDARIDKKAYVNISFGFLLNLTCHRTTNFLHRITKNYVVHNLMSADQHHVVGKNCIK